MVGGGLKTCSYHCNLHLRNIGDDTGALKIPRFSNNITYKLLVDVGLERGSGLICLLQHDPTLVLMGFEAHPINFGTAYDNMLRRDVETEPIRNRILLMPLALSNKDEYVSFNENYAPACGSIASSKEGGWWCSKTVSRRSVPAVRLDSILSMVPSNYVYHYLKIDVEGAERIVVEGGGKFIAKFDMISLEVDKSPGSGGREDSPTYNQLTGVLAPMGFAYHTCVKFASYDCHFAKSNAFLYEAIRLHTMASRFPRVAIPTKECPRLYKQNYIDFFNNNNLTVAIL
jgi:FkbM family methyltransferase